MNQACLNLSTTERERSHECSGLNVSRLSGTSSIQPIKSNIGRMKTGNLILICFMMLTSAVFGQKADKSDDIKTSKSEISWQKTQTIDLGKIEKGKPVVVSFEFTNTGNSPLFIISARGTCGCTTIDYSKEVITPRGNGFVKTTYDAGATGSFDKAITVTVNTQEKPIVLHIKGVVI